MYSKYTENMLYIVETMVKDKLTLRESSKIFKIPKSTIHEWIHSCLKNIDENLYVNALILFSKNKKRGYQLGYWIHRLAKFTSEGYTGQTLVIKADASITDKIIEFLSTSCNIAFKNVKEKGVIKCYHL